MDTETALLTAVHSQLKTTFKWTDQQCNIEFDEIPPATVGDFYVAIVPAGWQPGPRNNTAGGILDEIISIDVVVIQRAPKLPRDRQRQLFLDTLSGINIRHREILNAFGQFNYTVLNAATALMTKPPGGTVLEGFVEALRFTGLDPRPRIAPGAYFASDPGEEFAGLVRAAHYGGARRIQHIAPYGVT